MGSCTANGVGKKHINKQFNVAGLTQIFWQVYFFWISLYSWDGLSKLLVLSLQPSLESGVQAGRFHREGEELATSPLLFSSGLGHGTHH